MTFPDLAIAMPPEAMAQLREQLDPRQFRSAQFQIVSRTTRKLAQIIQQAVQKHSPISPKYVKRVIDTVKPQGDPPVGAVRVRKEPLPLIAFKYRSRGGDGISVIVSTDGEPITLRHAFLRIMPSGHKGIFLRSRHTPTKGPGSFLRDKHGQPFYKLTPRGIAGRLAIEEAKGPSVLRLVSIPEVLKDIEFDTIAFMQKTALSQLDRFLKPKSAVAAVATER